MSGPGHETSAPTLSAGRHPHRRNRLWTLTMLDPGLMTPDRWRERTHGMPPR